MKKLANYTKWLLMLSGIFMIVVGVMIFTQPFGSAWAIGSTVGWILLMIAIIDVISFIANFDRFYAGWLFIRALVTGLVGGMLVFHTIESVDIIIIAFGAWIIVTGAVQFANSFIARSLGQREWFWPLVGGIIEIIAGAIVVFNPGLGLAATAYVLAVSLIVDGVVNFVDAFKIQQGLNDVKRWEKAIAKLLPGDDD